MRILIVEPFASGHHANYLRWLVQAATLRRCGVVIASTAAAMSHPSLAAIATEFDDVHVHIVDERYAEYLADLPARGAVNLARRELGFWRSFRRAAGDVIASTRIDGVVLPYLDYCYHAIALLGSPFHGIPWCGISMRLAWMPDAAGRKSAASWKWRLTKRVLADSSLKALFIINPSVRDLPSDWCSAESFSKLRYLPDPAEYVACSRSVARAALGIADEAVAILVYGSIDERKGVDALAAALVSDQSLGNYVVILAGRQSASARENMQLPPLAQLQAEGRLIALDRVLSEAEQGLILAAADVMWVGYRNHLYMSGVLVLAGRAGLPVIGTPEGEVGRLVLEHRLGAVARIDRPADVADALRVMLDEQTRMHMGGRARLAFAAHTAEDFGASVLQAFGMLPAP